jgi:iron complex outermembrane receptor protein
MWTIDAANSLFSGVTRAVRTPSRVETDYTTASLANPAVPSFVRLLPNPSFDSEKLTAYEVGYRVRTLPSLYVTASAFFNDLENTLSTELLPQFTESTPPPERLVIPVTFANGLRGQTHGLELTTDFRPISWWRTTANYSWLRVEMTRKPGSTDVSQERRYEGLSPRHQIQLVSALDLPQGLSLDWFFRYVSELPAGNVKSYATSNIRASWRPHQRLEIAVVGRNLHHGQHLEWPAGAAGNVQIRRSADVNVIWRH